MEEKNNNQVIINNNVYSDDTYMALVNEFDQIRTCIGMYISKANTEGAMHLWKEIFNNALDECVNPHSPSKKIYVTFDEVKHEFTVTDEGRGIPFAELVSVSTKKHTSTKFVRSEPWMKGQAGRNGVGIVVTVALSDYMSMTSYRGDKYKYIEFTDGVLKEGKILSLKKPQNGLCVKFIPSEKYLGEMDVTIDLVEDYLRRMSYLLPDDIKVSFYGNTNDDKTIKRDYKYQGLAANVQYLSSTLEFEPIDLVYECEDFDLLVSFSYDKTVDDMLINSYCNYIYTTEGGTHELAAQKAICDFFTREAKKLDPDNKFEVSYEDCKKGLIMAVNCRHLNPGFEGQHKTRVNNADVIQQGKRGVISTLYKYFASNNMLLRKIISYLRMISKARMETYKIKGIKAKKNSTFLDDSDIGMKFANIADRNYQGYKELVITEGLSAYGAIDNARNNTYQAVCALTGVSDNVFGLSLEQLKTKRIFMDLLNIMGCGVGPDFDINKLKWNKIIIMTDSDVDGSNITSLLLCFFFIFLRPIIDEGRLFKAIPPLYIVDTKSIKKYYTGDPWLFDKKDYYELFNTMISNNVEVGIDDDKEIRILKKKELRMWLELNGEYLLELDSLVKRSASEPLILEYACYYKLISLGDEHKFKKLIEETFSELTYDIYESSLAGSYEGKYVSLITDKLFMRMAQRFIQALADNPSFFIYCKNKNEKNDPFNKLTIGQFLKQMNSSFNININQRFKGLGEAATEVLFVTTLNPKIRRLIRMNIEDAKQALEIFDLLHGKSDNMREQRRISLENTKISYSDIDN